MTKCQLGFGWHMTMFVHEKALIRGAGYRAAFVTC